LDIVLTHDSPYNLENIYIKNPKFKEYSIPEGSIGIIPNRGLLAHLRSARKDLFSFYEEIIKKALNSSKRIYILRHSKEDIDFCREIKGSFSHNEKVQLIEDDLTAIELEKIIKKFDFIIASRYHSLVHAYKNNIPAFVIGWALKYKELMETFDQVDYFIDCREKLDFRKSIRALENLIKNYTHERKTILRRLKVKK